MAGTHHFVITIQAPHPTGGIVTSTNQDTYTPPQGWTRSDVFTSLRRETARNAGIPTPDHVAVLFFSLEPNQL